MTAKDSRVGLFSAQEEDYTFYTFKKAALTQSVPRKSLLYQSQIYMSLDSIDYERSVYTLWDWMGDVGGLFGSLTIIGHCIVSMTQYITGHGIVQEIIESIYRLEAPRSQVNVNDISAWL